VHPPSSQEGVRGRFLPPDSETELSTPKRATNMDVNTIKSLVRDIPDFPTPGIVFKDITPILQDPVAFCFVIEKLAEYTKAVKATSIVGVEARGFVFAAGLAHNLGMSLVPARKPGKLPFHHITEEYALEYGTNAIQMHLDAIKPGEQVVIVDDLLATGGTAVAAARLVERLGGKVAGIAFVIELDFLHGRDLLKGYDVFSLVKF